MEEGAPLCRWRSESIILDVMPTHQQIFGFGSPWYEEAMRHSISQELPSGKLIRMITAPYFLACKFAAFDNRGNNDFMMSHDMEDIVAVVDGRPGLAGEIGQASDPLRAHLARRFRELVGNPRFREALPGNMPPDAASQARVPIIFERMRIPSLEGILNYRKRHCGEGILNGIAHCVATEVIWKTVKQDLPFLHERMKEML
ncbi:MAG: hypothetical protein C0613_06330 [Desulfobulbaceae bacterium]|nr:MAG: hypothetical protein C0613_06330 [Desulfobulbaceae bacterium]